MQPRGIHGNIEYTTETGLELARTPHTDQDTIRIASEGMNERYEVCNKKDAGWIF